jgi:hypothetical protein
VSDFMAGNFAREAAAALLRWYRASSDPDVNIRLLEKAAELKDRVGERPVEDLPPAHRTSNPKAEPDVP